MAANSTEVLQELTQSVKNLQMELQRMNNNLQKLHGQQETVTNICQILSKWMEKSPIIKELKEKQDISPQDFTTEKT